MTSLYTMVSVGLNIKRKKRFDSLSWSLVVRYFYTRRGYILFENYMRNKSRLGKRERRRGRLPFSLQIFQFYYVIKGVLTCLNK